MTPVLVPFKAEHLMSFIPRDSWWQENWKLSLDKENGGPSFTAMVNTNILGCAGVIIPHPGLAMAWMVLNKDIEHYGLWITRTVKLLLRDIKRAYELHRIELIVFEYHERNRRWAEILGFTIENNGIARAYTPEGQNMIRYEMVE